MAEAILTTLNQHPGSFGVKSLFRELGFPKRKYTEYRHTLHELLDDGRIERLGKRRLSARRKPEIVKGILRLTSHGYGFVDREADSSIFISAREARKAFDGDLIQVEVIQSGHEAGPEGLILNVDASQRPPLLGRLQRRGGEWLAEVKTGPYNFWAKVEESDNSLHPGDLALLNVPGTRRRYPPPSCQVVKILGSPDEKGVAEKGLMASFGMEEGYPEEAIREASSIRAESSKPGFRRDLRNEYVITIDPADARDHDDAVSLRRDGRGNFLLGVHIADVSRYIPEGSAVDKEAQRRSFSVYLQHHHLPMLPPRLPGELCSLKPGRDRLALSVLLHIDRDGKVLKRDIAPSRLRVRRLISYEIAQEHLDAVDEDQTKGEFDSELRHHLSSMWRLARALKGRRLSEGGVDFDLPEAGFHWEDGAAPRRIFRQSRLESHQLVEEFMLAANRAVAEIWAEKFGEKAANAFRVHPPPDAEKRQKLSDYLADAGFEWPPEKLGSAAEIAAMLDEAQRRFPPEVTAVIARKALMLASYEAQPRGHFGLGFKRYLHFTSPIRRYADLTVHRLLWQYIIPDHSIENRVQLQEKLEAVCQHLCERERLIADLEREANKLSGLLYLNERRDQTFPARLVEATQERLYVALEELFMEGSLTQNSGVQFRSRRKTSVRHDRRESSGGGLAIGDRLMVNIAGIDFLNRKLELQPL